MKRLIIALVAILVATFYSCAGIIHLLNEPSRMANILGVLFVVALVVTIYIVGLWALMRPPRAPIRFIDAEGNECIYIAGDPSQNLTSQENEQ